MKNIDVDVILKSFCYQIHICEIIPANYSKPKKLKIKSNFHPLIAKTILKNYIPPVYEWEYKQDERIKKWRITTKYEF